MNPIVRNNFLLTPLDKSSWFASHDRRCAGLTTRGVTLKPPKTKAVIAKPPRPTVPPFLRSARLPVPQPA
jgi:hypothetical protein